MNYTHYDEMKELRNEFRETGLDPLWSNLTMSIEEANFKVEYNYDDLLSSSFDNYERHIIWRYKYLNIGPEQVNNKDKQILSRYLAQIKSSKDTSKTDIYTDRIYITDVGNIVAYNTREKNEEIQQREEEQEEVKDKPKKKNQILFSEEEMKN